MPQQPPEQWQGCYEFLYLIKPHPSGGEGVGALRELPREQGAASCGTSRTLAGMIVEGQTRA